VVADIGRQLSGPEPPATPLDIDILESDRGETKPREVSMAEEEDVSDAAIPDDDFSEEEDLESRFEMGDEFEEDLFPDQEGMLKRLADLGFDRAFVMKLLCHNHGNEAQVRQMLGSLGKVMG
jgi:hypothetical protein